MNSLLALMLFVGSSLFPTQFEKNFDVMFGQSVCVGACWAVTVVCSYPCCVLSCFSSQGKLTSADPVLACTVAQGYHHHHRHHHQTLKYVIYKSGI
jgi:hypothetical protein